MGWANGSEMAKEIWDELGQYVPKNKKRKAALWLYELFENYDADDWDGTSQLEQDAGLEPNDEDF